MYWPGQTSRWNQLVVIVVAIMVVVVAVMIAVAIVVLFAPFPVLALLLPPAAFIVAMLTMGFCFPRGVVNSFRGAVRAVSIRAPMLCTAGEQGNHQRGSEEK